MVHFSMISNTHLSGPCLANALRNTGCACVFSIRNPRCLPSRLRKFTAWPTYDLPETLLCSRYIPGLPGAETTARLRCEKGRQNHDGVSILCGERRDALEACTEGGRIASPFTQGLWPVPGVPVRRARKSPASSQDLRHSDRPQHGGSLRESTRYRFRKRRRRVG